MWWQFWSSWSDLKADLDGQSRWIASLGSQSETNPTGFEVFEILTGLGGVDENASLGSQSETNPTGFEVFEILTGLRGVGYMNILLFVRSILLCWPCAVGGEATHR